MSSKSVKPKGVKGSATAPDLGIVTEGAIERIADLVVHRAVEKLADAGWPVSVSAEELEQTFARIAKQVLESIAQEFVGALIAQQQEIRDQLERLEVLLTDQRSVLDSLGNDRPKRPGDLSDTSPERGVPVRQEPCASELQHGPLPSVSAGEGEDPRRGADQIERTASLEWASRVKRGEALRGAWVKEGLLVSSTVLSGQWHRTRQALDQACVRGELFFVKIGKNKYYPSAFLQLDADAVKQVNLALRGDDGAAKFMFWLRKHGALGGQMVTKALRDGQLARVVELARGWSEERGLVEAPPSSLKPVRLE